MRRMAFALGVLGLAAVQSSTASARERRINGYDCVQQADARTPIYLDGGASVSLAGSRLLACPYDEDDRMPKTAVTALNIHGSVANNTATAKVCSVQFASDVSFAPTFCTTAQKQQQNVNNAVWSFNAAELAPAWGSVHGGDFGYVTVDYGASGSVIQQTIRGVWTFAP
jgi:hypothetical protein